MGRKWIWGKEMEMEVRKEMRMLVRRLTSMERGEGAWLPVVGLVVHLGGTI